MVILSEKFLVSEIVTLFYINCDNCVKTIKHITGNSYCFRAGANTVVKKEQFSFMPTQRPDQRIQRTGFNLSKTFDLIIKIYNLSSIV